MTSTLDISINDFVCNTNEKLNDIISMAKKEYNIEDDKINEIKDSINININLNKDITDEYEEILIVIFKLIREAGIKITIKDMDPFEYALSKNNLKLFKILTQKDKEEALNICLLNQNNEIAQALINEGADITKTMIREIKKYNLAYYLIVERAIKLGANPSTVTIEDMTKLASSGKLSIVMLVLEETKPDNSKKLWNYFRSLKQDNYSEN